MHKIKPIYFAVFEPFLQQLSRGHDSAWRPEQSYWRGSSNSGPCLAPNPEE